MVRLRESVRPALVSIAGRFSSDVPLVDTAALRSRYGAFEAWPADAQLGLSVLAWALGPGFHVRGFRESVNALVPDFARAASTLEALGAKNTSLITLTGIARAAFRNAAVILECDLNPEILYSPLDLTSCTI